MEAPRIGGLPTPHGIDRLSHERRERRGKGSFQEAFEQQGHDQGQRPHEEGQGSTPTPTPTPRPQPTTPADPRARVQDTPGNGRREDGDDGDGNRHVDVLA